MAKEYITIRLESKDIMTINQLVKAGATESRSKFIRESVKSRLSEYTGEPNLRDVSKRLSALESQFNALKSKLEDTVNGL